MSDNSELKQAAEGAVNAGDHWGRRDSFERQLAKLASPEAVLALIDENERLQGCEDVLRQLASYCGCGGYNAPEVEPEVFAKKIMDGINILNDPLMHLAEKRGAERDQLRAEVAGLKTGYEAYERVNAELKAGNEALRATADLQKLLPEVSDALEELELHGLHSDQGYRKLKDWNRKVGLAYRVIQGPMFGAEHGELVSQNTWLRSVVEHYAQQHAPLEPIPDMEGWSARLPGYDLPSLLRDAERYRWLRRAGNTKAIALVAEHCLDALDEAIDAALGQGEQS